jgi:NAD(P)-dependent dehydrogenase (short-subunit alcohol dehydrogenase family)
MGSLNGKRIVVIGGTSGIGFAVAAGAAKEGAQVIVASSTKEKVSSAVAKLPAGSKGEVVNVRDEKNIASFFAGIGAFDHLVYTAGDWAAIGNMPLDQLDLSKAGDVFATRFWGALACVKHSFKQMAKDGSVTLTDGMVGWRPRKGAPVNSAMAGAVEHLARSLAIDLAPRRANCVCPGLVATEVWDGPRAEGRAERFAAMAAKIPVGKISDADDVAEAYLYLMRCGYTTGQTLYVEGGMSLV